MSDVAGLRIFSMIWRNCSRAFVMLINWSKQSKSVAHDWVSRKYVLRVAPHPMRFSVGSHGVPMHEPSSTRFHTFVVLAYTWLNRSMVCSVDVKDSHVPCLTFATQESVGRMSSRMRSS